jgi:hypothetical protein
VKLAIVGSRDYRNRGAVRAYVQQLPADTVVVTGGWPSHAGGYKVVEATAGVDREAYLAAEAAGLTTVLVAGSKTKHGRMAGKVRNPTVVELCDALVAFWTLASAGTANTLALALAAGKPMRVVGPEGTEVHESAWQAEIKKITTTRLSSARSR